MACRLQALDRRRSDVCCRSAFCCHERTSLTPSPLVRLRILHTSLVWIVLFALSSTWAGAASKPLEPLLEKTYDDWLVGVSQLLLPAELEVFQSLENNVHRELFIRSFWRAREFVDPSQLPPVARWHLNFEEARQRFESLDEDRAQALIMAGKPARVLIFADCRTVIRPIRIWTYGPWHARTERQENFHLVFYRESSEGPYHLWSPSEGTGPVMFEGPARGGAWPVDKLIDYAMDKNCFRWAPEEASPFATALRQATGLEELRRMTLPPTPEGSWLESWRQEMATGKVANLPATLTALSFPGRYQAKTIVRGRIAIPVENIERNAAGKLVDRMTIVGDIWLGNRLVDSFRVVHLVAGTPAAATVNLDFYRRLRPGDYRLDLRVEDAHGRGLLRSAHPLAVPRLEHEAPVPAGHRLGLPGLTRTEVGLLTTFPSIEILAPADDLLAGHVELAAVTTGGPIERIEFHLDGVAAGSDDTPPYAVTLALAAQPQPVRVAAIAMDPEGREIARDTITLNSGPRRFAVRWVEPAVGSIKPATIQVDLPSGKVLNKVEIYLNQHLTATLREPPFVVPLPTTRPLTTTYARAVATTLGGESTEDIIFLSAPDNREEVDVQLVELYTSVTDSQGRFVTGLTAPDFEIVEDGQIQPIQQFDTVENLAINVALLMDVSTSMRKKMETAIRSAQRFFETVLTPKDRASLLAFNHDIRRVVRFTHNVDDLRYGVDGFRAWGTTRLHDGVIYTVHSFGGLQGKRALVLLSDGQDVDSDFYFKQVLEQTLRSAVAVYPIALGVEDPLTVEHLQHLANDSGGRFFQISGVGELDRIYRRIEEELRSQYLLVYQPPTNDPQHEFRRVNVTVKQPGLKARSIHGYYP